MKLCKCGCGTKIVNKAPNGEYSDYIHGQTNNAGLQVTNNHWNTQIITL